MSSPIITHVNRQTRTLLAAPGGNVPQGIASIPSLFAYDQPQFRLDFFDPPTSITQAYSLVDMTGFTCNVDLGPTPTGSGGGATSFSRGNAFDSNNKWFLCAPLDLSQAGTLALITGASVYVDLEISLWQSGQSQFRFSQTVQLFSVLDTGSVSNPPPAGAVYPTTQDARAGFLSKGPTKNDSKIWLSADGTKAILMYLGNDGEMKYIPINPPPTALY